MHKMKEVFASLYNDRAISYRVHKGFEHDVVALSAGCSAWCARTSGAAGVMFTIDTELALKTWCSSPAAMAWAKRGAGRREPRRVLRAQAHAQGGQKGSDPPQPGLQADPDGVSTPEEKAATRKLVKTIDVPAEQRNRYSLTDADVEQLAHYALVIEQHYGRPMDIEWGKDGTDGQLYILQARPETVKSQARPG